MSAFPCEVIVSYFRVIFFLAPVECYLPRVSWTFPLYWFSLKSIRGVPIYLLEQCISSFAFAITEDQRLDNLEGKVVHFSHSSRSRAISSEVLILHAWQWWKAAGDRTEDIACWAVIGPYEDLSISGRTSPVLQETHYSLLNPYVPTPLHYQSTSAWVVIVPVEHIKGSVTSCCLSVAKLWLAKPPGVYNTKKAVFASRLSRQIWWFRVYITVTKATSLILPHLA